MVPLVPVQSEFAGRVLVAKLGSAGILAELRGVSRIYPTLLSSPVVWVEATEAGDARELITADLDDVLTADDAVPAAPEESRAAWHPVRLLMVLVALVLLASLSVGTRSCSASASPTSSVTTR